MEIPGVKEITEENVVDLIKRAAHTNVGIWIAGGWGVDALIGHQTRPHNDFDLFVHKKDKIAITGMLEVATIVVDIYGWIDYTTMQFPFSLLAMVDDTMRKREKRNNQQWSIHIHCKE